MSFSSTPLGQGRRLDHHTFLNKLPSSSTSNNYITRPSSPPRSQIPASYAYGASTAGTRSPPKPSSSHSAVAATDVDDADQPVALIQYARITQTKQLQATQSEPNLNTNINTNPSRSGALFSTSSKPEEWSVRDTSVQIASAFHQAAFTTPAGYNIMQRSGPNDAWASGITRPTVPRSSSVEYEKETQSTVRRLGAPPPRNNRLPNRPIVKSTSLHHVPDSEPEEEQPPRTERGKSPFEHAVDLVKSYAPTSFFLRSPSQDPENRSANDANGDQPNTNSSYDYSAEERDYQAASLKPVSRRGAAHRRNRISVDNKAYRPSMSDLEESDDDVEEDGRRTRRKKTKKGTGYGGPLTTLPVAGYDKRRKRRRGTKTNGVDEGEEEESSEEQEQEQEQLRVSEQRSARGTTPVARAPSVSRSSVPPPSRMSAPRTSAPPPDTSLRSDPNASMDVEQALDSILEIEEPPEVEDEHIAKKSFSVGASLGRTVHWLLATFWTVVSSLLAVLSFMVNALTRTIQFAVELFFLRPIHTLQTNSLALAKYAVLTLSMYLAWRTLQSGVSLSPMDYLPSLPIIRSTPTTSYQPPEVPPADISAWTDRLLHLESVVASLSRDTRRSTEFIEGEVKTQADFIKQLDSLELLIQKERQRAQDIESKFTKSASRELQSVKQQMDVLHSELQAQRRETQSRLAKSGTDEETRAQLKAFQAQLDIVESKAKEAIEQAKQTTSPTVETPSGDSLAWLNNIASGKQAGVTIKSTDGQDVTSLIDLIVDSAITKFSKDTIARVDFAMHSGGAHVIPSLTSDTFEVRPATFVGQMVGMITGNGYAIGRPPVTVLHHEDHNGHCWPFAGTQGQIGVALAAPVAVTDITIDHVAVDVATDIRSAPRQMEVWGLVDGQDNIAKVEAWKAQTAAAREAVQENSEEYAEYPSTLPKSPPYIRIASFTYDIHGPKHIQTFPADKEIRDLGVDFGVVVLLVKNNWGRDDLTCVYRMRVHGQRLGDIPLPRLEDLPMSR